MLGILGKNRVAVPSVGIAFSCGLNPRGRSFFLGPVFGDGGAGRRLEIRRSFPCLLVRVIELTFENSGCKYMVFSQYYQESDAAPRDSMRKWACL